MRSLARIALVLQLVGVPARQPQAGAPAGHLVEGDARLAGNRLGNERLAHAGVALHGGGGEGRGQQLTLSSRWGLPGARIAVVQLSLLGPPWPCPTQQETLPRSCRQLAAGPGSAAHRKRRWAAAHAVPTSSRMPLGGLASREAYCLGFLRNCEAGARGGGERAGGSSKAGRRRPGEAAATSGGGADTKAGVPAEQARCACAPTGTCSTAMAAGLQRPRSRRPSMHWQGPGMPQTQ